MQHMYLVDGGWSEWQNVTECSATCGEGVITQQRTCTQPSPSCGGRDCVGENTTNVSCIECCPGTYVVFSRLFGKSSYLLNLDVCVCV